MKKKKVRKMTILAKIMTAAGLCISASTIAIGMLGYLSMQNKVLEMAADKSQTIGIMATREIDANVIAELKVGDEDTAAYREVRTRLATIMRQTNVAYLYTLYTDGEKVYYGIEFCTRIKKTALAVFFDVV